MSTIPEEVPTQGSTTGSNQQLQVQGNRIVLPLSSKLFVMYWTCIVLINYVQMQWNLGGGGGGGGGGGAFLCIPESISTRSLIVCNIN